MQKTDLYRWFDSSGKLLYVGISLNAFTRAKEHSKKQWFAEAVNMTKTNYDTREQALEAEKLAIQTELPKHNIVHSLGVKMSNLYNIGEAAKFTGKSEMTIRKYLGLQGRPSRLPNAKKVETPSGYTWQIPEHDLIQAGLCKSVQIEPSNELDVLKDLIKVQAQMIQQLLDIKKL